MIIYYILTPLADNLAWKAKTCKKSNKLFIHWCSAHNYTTIHNYWIHISFHYERMCVWKYSL